MTFSHLAGPPPRASQALAEPQFPAIGMVGRGLTGFYGFQEILARRAACGALNPKMNFRVGPEARATIVDDGRKAFGTCAIYDVASPDLGGFKELYTRGCFARSLADPQSDPRILLNHSHGHILGRRSAGTARFFDTPTGVDFEVDIPGTVWADDLAKSMERGDINQAGIAFVALEGYWDHKGRLPTRVITRADLVEASVVSFPAFPQTSAQLAKGHLALMGRRLASLKTTGGIQ